MSKRFTVFKWLAPLLLLFSLLSLLMGTVITARADNTATFGMNWEYNGNFYTVGGNTITTTNTNNGDGNVAYAPNSVTGRDYTVTATFSGSSSYGSGQTEKRISLIPWRVSDGDLIFVSLVWQSNHGTHANKLLNVRVYEYSGGAYQGARTDIDYWLDHSSLSCAQLAPTATITLKIVKTSSSATSTDTYTIYVNNELVRTFDSTISYSKHNATQSIGVHALNETATYTNVSVSTDTSGGGGGGTPSTGNIEALDKTFAGNGSIWSASGGNLVGASGGWLTDYAVTPAGQTGDYVVEATLKGTGNSTDSASGEIVFGVLPWYVDNNNYLLVMFKWTNEAEGLIDVCIVNAQDTSDFNSYQVQETELSAKSVRASDTLNIKIEKYRDTYGSGKDVYAIYLNGEYIRQDSYRASVDNTATPQVGVWAHKDTVTVSALNVSAYVADGGNGDGEDFGSDGGIDFGSDDYVDAPTEDDGGANEFWKALVPWGIVVLCVICIIPFVIGMIKRAIYKAKKK